MLERADNGSDCFSQTCGCTIMYEECDAGMSSNQIIDQRYNDHDSIRIGIQTHTS